MAKVTFLPSNQTVEVDSGISLLDTARKAGVLIHAPCGSKGTCGKCLVEVIAGEIVSNHGREKSNVLACQSFVADEDVTVIVPDQELFTLDRYEDEDYNIFYKQKCGPELSLKLIDRYTISKPESLTVEDNYSDLQLLKTVLPERLKNLSVQSFSLSLITNLPKVMLKDETSLSVFAFNKTDSPLLFKIEETKKSENVLVLAIDVGTTGISVQLMDLESEEVIATRSGYNEQIACGLDIISRINYASSDERLSELQARVIKTINRLIDKIVLDHNVQSEDIISAAISGNTVMTHLLYNIKPERIRLDPYMPAAMELPLVKASDLGIAIFQDAPVSSSPALGSYVGGDITAGLLCTDLLTDENISLFIDVGTNGEIAIGNKDFILTCACSAGPAFEGGGIACGMRATTGAIYKVTHMENDSLFTSVIGDTQPEGICGSGVIDSIAQLLINTKLDKSGKIIPDETNQSIVKDKKKFIYILNDDETKVYISEIDIENIMRAKAAIFAATTLLLDHIGITMDEIKKIYIAGGFGKYVNIENAITLGMFPDVSRDIYEYIGNASLKGTGLLLQSEKYRTLQKEIRNKATYIDLSSDSTYMDHYTSALFFPHTDDTLFPSIKI